MGCILNSNRQEMLESCLCQPLILNSLEGRVRRYAEEISALRFHLLTANDSKIFKHIDQANS